MTNRYDVGVLVMRMQVDVPTKPHTELLRYVQAHHNKMLVVLGVTGFKQPTKDNPLDYQTREAMVRELFPSDEYPNVRVIGMPDEEYDDKWSAHLDDRIEVEFPHHTVGLYGGRGSFKSHYSGKFQMGEVPDEIRSLDESSGTNARRKIAMMVPPQYPSSASFLDDLPPELLGDISHNNYRQLMRIVAKEIGVAFRQGAIYTKQHEFDKINATADIAILRYNDWGDYPWSFLAGKKRLDLPWRFPGGFVDPKDKSYAAAAVREGFEETGVIIDVNNVLSVADGIRINDWRCPSNEGIMTDFYAAMMPEGQEPVAGDDIKQVGWIQLLPDVPPASEFEPCHAPLYEELVSFLKYSTPSEFDLRS